MPEPARIPGEITSNYYYSPNFAAKGLTDLDGLPILNTEDILSHLVRRSQRTQPTLPAFEIGSDRFSTYLKTLPRKDERFASFFNSAGDITMPVFDQLWSCLKETHSPGAPLNYLYAQNLQANPARAEIYEVVNSRVKKLIELGKQLYHEPSYVATQEQRMLIVSDNFADPMLCDIKKEPRPNGKLPRLVTQASIVDQMVHRIFMHELLYTLQDSEETDMAVGLDIITQEKTKERYDVFKAHAPLTQNDVQGWEYSVNETDHYAACYADAYQMNLVDDRCEICVTGRRADHFYGLLGMTFTIVNRVTLTKAGKLLLLPPGQMPSGILVTFQRNSRIRALLSFNVSMDCFGKPVEFVRTAGDDCVDSNNFKTVEDSLAAHAKYGKVVTDVATGSDQFTFCSTVFTSSFSYQENIEKSAYKLIADQTYDAENVSQFVACYRFHPRFVEVMTLITRYQTEAHLTRE